MTGKNSNARKHVLWINHFVPYPAKGGLLIRTHGLLSKVVQEHDVTLLCLVQPRLIQPYFKDLESGLKEAKTFYQSQGVNIEFFDMPSEKSRLSRLLVAFTSLFSRKPYSVRWLYSPKLAARLQALNSQSFDYVHVDTMGLMEMVPEFSRDAVVTINHHNAEHVMMARRANKEANWLKRFYYQLESQKIAKFDSHHMQVVKSHVVCSPEDKSSLTELASGLAVDVVPNGVSYLPAPKRLPIIGRFLFVGGLDWYPNTDAILFLLDEVCPRLKSLNAKVNIDIVGKNPSAEIIAKANAFNFVELHGYVDDIELMYANAQAFLCPLRDGGGTKLKVLDAMNHGLPVIGTEIAFEGIAVEDGVSGFVTNTAEQVCSVIASIIDNVDFSERVGSKARTLVKNRYDSNVISKNYAKKIAQAN